VKNLSFIVFITLVSSMVTAQIIEEQVVNSFFNTSHTGGSFGGHWTRIASCTNTYGWEDFGTVFELFGNNGGGNTFFYGTLIARIKRQSPEPGNPTNYSFFLYNSNIGQENIKGVVNGTTINIYLRINDNWTTYYFRRISRGGSVISGVSNQPFLTSLPVGDFVINCTEGNQRVENLVVNGNVVIGTSSVDGYKLAVNGPIRAKEIKVETGWSDFVFEEDYALPSLSELELFIKSNKHLPDIPSASEVEANGINVGEMNAKLLQKIEELTLYVIEQEKNQIALLQRIQDLETNFKSSDRTTERPPLGARGKKLRNKSSIRKTITNQ
jgi:hypothetical protein